MTHPTTQFFRAEQVSQEMASGEDVRDLAMKTPGEVKAYTWDLDAWMANLEAEVGAVLSVTPDTGLTVDSSSNTTTAITAFLSGGTAGVTYKVRARFTTTDAQTLEADIFVPVANVKS